MELSIVTTLYCSEPHIKEFCNRMTATAKKITHDFELILVNDGSPDNSLTIALELYHTHHNIKVIDLSRNFGHHKAMMTGLEHAKGNKIFLIDCDLEEPPELLENFYQEFIRIKDADVVYGVQAKRKGGWFEKLSGTIFYNVFNFLSDYPIPKNLVIMRLMSKQYVDNLVLHKEKETAIAGLWAITGFKQIPIIIDKKCLSPSTYSLKNKLSMMLNSLTSFSKKPLVYIFYLGMLALLISFIYTINIIWTRIF